jgi:Zn-dependent protease with chaperone function
MTSAFASLEIVLLTLLLFAGVAAGICACVVRPVVGWLARIAPRQRVFWLFGFIASPALVSLLLTAVCLLPWLVSVAAPALDHCESDVEHSHLCFNHPPAAEEGGWAVLSVAAGYVLWRFTRGFLAALRSRRLVSQLRAASRPRREPCVAEVPSSAPLCIAAGFVRPTVIVSTGLVASLPPDELRAVLAHERAHVARRDALLLAVARAFAVLHVPWFARRVLDELELACELACDEEAARSVGDRLVVASAIVSVNRAMAGTSAVPALGFANFGARSLDVRVRALVEIRSYERAPSVWPLGAITALALCSTNLLHHGTETLLSVLLH